MKKAILMGALLAMLVMCLSAVTAVSASATVWLCNAKEPANATECEVKSENLSIVQLIDMSAGSGAECPVGSVLDKGFVGPGAKDETTEVTFVEEGKKCTAPEKVENLKKEMVKNACEKVETVKAIHLPWATTAETIKAELWDKTKGTKAKEEPGYVVTCTAAKIKGIKDTCEGNEAKPPRVALDLLALDEETKVALVDLLFNKETFQEKEGIETESEWGKCSIGGANSALVIGEILLFAFILGKEVPLTVEP